MLPPALERERGVPCCKHSCKPLKARASTAAAYRLGSLLSETEPQKDCCLSMVQPVLQVQLRLST